MSVPPPRSGRGDGEKGRVRLAAPVNLEPEDARRPVSCTMGPVSFLAPRQRIKPGLAPVKLSVLMCVFNEERTIELAIDEVLAADYPCDMELIVVDDGSTDETPTLLAQINDPRVIIHLHRCNQGKGSALLSAAAIASGTHILPFDADLEYSPDDITRIIYPVLKGRCDVVYGARIFGLNTVYSSYWHAVGNRLLTRMANILFNASLSDLHTCLKLIPLATFRSLKLRESGFGLDTEVTALLLKAGVRPFEVPVTYYGRTHDEGKKITWRDAVACISILLRVRLLRSSRPKGIPASQEDDEKVGVVPQWGAGPGWGSFGALGIRDDGQPNAVTT